MDRHLLPFLDRRAICTVLLGLLFVVGARVDESVAAEAIVPAPATRQVRPSPVRVSPKKAMTANSAVKRPSATKRRRSWLTLELHSNLLMETSDVYAAGVGAALVPRLLNIAENLDLAGSIGVEMTKQASGGVFPIFEFGVSPIFDFGSIFLGANAGMALSTQASFPFYGGVMGFRVKSNQILERIFIRLDRIKSEAGTRQVIFGAGFAL